MKPKFYNMKQGVIISHNALSKFDMKLKLVILFTQFEIQVVGGEELKISVGQKQVEQVRDEVKLQLIFNPLLSSFNRKLLKGSAS